jgi:hypothetical protein
MVLPLLSLPRLRLRLRSVLLVLLAPLAAACMREDAAGVFTAGQPWESRDVLVEVRAHGEAASDAIANGRNEVVVGITAEHRRPVFDAMVELRAVPGGAWVQAIEDGHVGVYRRAVDFGADARNATLEVRLRREGETEAVLRFPSTGFHRVK